MNTHALINNSNFQYLIYINDELKKLINTYSKRENKTQVRNDTITGILTTDFTEDTNTIIRRINGLNLFNLEIKEMEAIAKLVDELCTKFNLRVQTDNHMDIRDFFN